MGNFKQKNRFGGRGNSGGFSGRHDSGRTEMHKAVCSACGKDCEVPFRPTGDKPVFCSDCFRNKRNDEPRRSGGRDSGRFDSGDRKMYDAVCDKCGQKCEVPFRPTGDKPIYCSQCFGKGGRDGGSDQRGGRDGGSDQAGKQFDIINAKLDKIIKALSPVVSAEKDEKKEVIKKTEVLEPKKVTKDKSKGKKVVSPKKPKAKKKK